MDSVDYFDSQRKIKPTIESLAAHIAAWCPNYLKVDHTDSPAQSIANGTPAQMTGCSGSLTVRSADLVLYSGFVTLSSGGGTARAPTVLFQIKRDSTVIQTFEVRAPSTVNHTGGVYFNVSFGGYDRPGTGTFTYSIYWANPGTVTEYAYSARQFLNCATIWGIQE